MMLEAAKYSAMERLRDGGTVEIRALTPEEEPGLLAAIDRTSSLSMYRRFVGAKREFSEKERAFFVNVDFVSHVAEVRLVICDLSASPYLDHAGSAQTSVADADWAISDRQRCEP